MAEQVESENSRPNQPHSDSPFLELSRLAALQNMRFSTRQRIEGAYSGKHTSRTQGGSGEFADYREYSPGEDLRRLDWKVLARTGRTYIKTYQDETNLVCAFALDCSGSMQFGAASPKDQTGSKLQYAQYFLTALSHIIGCGRDQVGLSLIREQLDDYLNPGSTPAHIQRVHQELAAATAGQKADWNKSLNELFQRSHRRGVLLVCSDFLSDDPEAMFGAMRLFKHRGWEIIALHLVHPDEEQLPTGTAYRFEGLEGEGSVNCSPGEIEAIYKQNFNQHLSLVRSLALSTGCDYRLVSTRVPYWQTLSGFLVERTG